MKEKRGWQQKRQESGTSQCKAEAVQREGGGNLRLQGGKGISPMNAPQIKIKPHAIALICPLKQNNFSSLGLAAQQQKS